MFVWARFSLPRLLTVVRVARFQLSHWGNLRICCSASMASWNSPCLGDDLNLKLASWGSIGSTGSTGHIEWWSSCFASGLVMFLCRSCRSKQPSIWFWAFDVDFVDLPNLSPPYLTQHMLQMFQFHSISGYGFSQVRGREDLHHLWHSWLLRSGVDLCKWTHVPWVRWRCGSATQRKGNSETALYLDNLGQVSVWKVGPLSFL